MKNKKIPLRKCVSCNEKKSKKDLMRIVKDSEDNIKLDPSGKANGRGAYVCLSLDCIDEAEKTKRLSRSLGMKVSKDIYDELRKLVNQVSN